MTMVVEVASPGAVPGPPEMVGVPVLSGPEGPRLPDGLPRLGDVAPEAAELPAVLDAGWCTRRGFSAKPGQVLTVEASPGGPVVALVGLGPADRLDAERWRKAAAALVRAAGEGGTVALILPPAPLGASAAPAGPVPGDAAALVGAAVAEGAVLAAYRFDPYRTTPRPGPAERLVVVPADDRARTALAGGAGRGARAARAVCLARDLINTPPGDLPPSRLAARAVEELSGVEGVAVEVWDEARIAEERLGGLLGVSRGSDQPPRLVRATFEPSEALEVGGRVPHVVLVGKGITFDSGGLSLKSADGMTTMKTDMSGAAVVLSVLSACADLGVRVRVTAIAPITENMPGGRAIKPGDVLSARSGATIEVLNTDAEGRLVLADALCLAAELEPDAIVDVATLTGAATVALGSGIAALFGNDDALVERVRASGERAGERSWRLPLPEEYADHIDSDVADMKNVGRPGQAGAIAAALLLARFVGTVPWAHLDIAGTGRAAESAGYLSKGGTGFGVRTLIELLASYDRAGPG